MIVIENDWDPPIRLWFTRRTVGIPQLMVEICENIELLNDERWGHRNQHISGWGPSCNSQSSKEWTLSRTREAAILLVKLPIFIDVLSLQFNSLISCFSSKSQSSVDGLLLNIFTSYPRFNYIWKRGGDRIRTPGFAIKIIQKFPFLGKFFWFPLKHCFSDAVRRTPDSDMATEK